MTAQLAEILSFGLSTSPPLRLRSFTGTEGVSQLFRFDLELVSTRTEARVDPQSVLGMTTKVTAGGKRDFVGFINRFSWTGLDHRYHHYRAELVPWLWQLSLTADCRIFNHQTVLEMVQAIFEEHGFQKGKHFEFKVQQAYKPWDYCVQYRETDLNFVSRMLEQEGIFYFFQGEKMVLADSSSSAASAKVELDFNDDAQSNLEKEVVSSWNESFAIRPGQYRYRDYHFEKAEDSLEYASKSVNKWEIYDYPGEYAQRFDDEKTNHGNVKKTGERLVQIRLEEERTPGHVFQGSSTCLTLGAGGGLKLKSHEERSFEGKTYFVTSVQHAVREGSIDYSNGQVASYQNSFTCIPADVPYRAPRTTPKPVIQGLQNAVVVGDANQEIDVDQWGRVRVKFRWDRDPAKHGENSCRVRVAQSWAGKRWGAFFWPRIGQEVLVAFQEGDPEEPIIVGSAYNNLQPPPYLSQGPLKSFDDKHPHNFNLTGIKSNSTLEGHGFNEWRFDDTKQKEQIFIHAQRDMDVRVRHDSRERVIHDRHLIVGWEKDGDQGGDQREMVYQDKHLNVKRDHVEHIEGNVDYTVGHGKAEDGGTVQILIEKDRIETIEGNEFLHILKALAAQVDGPVSITLKSSTSTQVHGDCHQEIRGERREKVGGGQSLHVSGDRKERIGGNDHLLVTSDRNEKVEGTQSLTVGQNQYEKVGMIHALEAGQEVHIKAGAKLILEAGAQLSLKGPGGFVDIGAGGVTIVGTIVNINSGGSAGSGSGSKPKPPEAPALPEEPQTPPDAKQAEPKVPARADNSVTGSKSAP